jgi:hypothetical protein
MKWTPETAAPGRLRGEASAVSMACALGYPVGVADAAQVLVHEVIHPEKCW